MMKSLTWLFDKSSSSGSFKLVFFDEFALMKQRLFLFCAMGCLGMTVEIFFTAIYDIIAGTAETPSRLLGHSYIWMFPIYGSAGILFPVLWLFIGKWNVLLRALVYAAGIIVVEFITGWLLDVTTGQCPWEYKEGLHFMGYVRLDFIPFWAIFGLLIEKLLMFLMRKDSISH